MHNPVEQHHFKGSTVCAVWARSLALLFAAVLVAGCAAPTSGEGDTAGAGGVGQPTITDHQAYVDGAEVVFNVDSDEVRHEVPTSEGEPVFATARPGAHRDQTVLVVTRVEDDTGVRYELRYIVANPDEVSDLYWFPWRLQIADSTAGIADVAPQPVWAPDGEQLAWIEWDRDGSHVRTVGWVDDGVSNNPSDEVGRYPVPEVPAGVQLTDWETDDAGATTLVGVHDGQRYRIELP